MQYVKHMFSALSLLANERIEGLIERLGIPDNDVATLVGDRLWLGGERHTVRRVMDAVLYGALDALGLQRFELSAEYIAAWIALIVHPTNYEVACSWYHGAQSAEDLTSDPELVPIAEGITAAQLHAHVMAARISVNDSEYQTFRHTLAHTVQRALEAQQQKVQG